MIGRWRIEGHAIVSADDRIADASGAIPPGLQVEADWNRFQRELDRASVVALGRLSHQAYPNLRNRNRLVLSSTSAGLERRSDGFFYCGVHSHKPNVCADYKATNALCRVTNQVPNEGRQAHSVQWIYLTPEALRMQTTRGYEAQVDPFWVARGYWPEVEEAARALERAAVASLT